MKVLLLVLNLLVAGVVAVEWRNPPAHPAPPAGNDGTGAPAEVEIADLGRFELPPQGHYAEVVQRPLFEPDRRLPPAEAKKRNRGSIKELELTGIVITPQGHAALFRRAGKPEVLRVTPGQRVAGWRVEEIQPRRVVLSSGGERRVLEVHRFRPERSGAERDGGARKANGQD